MEEEEKELTFLEKSRRFRERKKAKGWNDARIDDWLDKKASVLNAEESGDLSGIEDPSTLRYLKQKGVTDTTDVMSNLRNKIKDWTSSEDLIREYGGEGGVALDIIKAEYDKFHKDKWGKTKESIETQQAWQRGETPTIDDKLPEGGTVGETIKAAIKEDGNREEALADMKENEDLLIERGIDPSLIKKWIDEEYPEGGLEFSPFNLIEANKEGGRQLQDFFKGIFKKSKDSVDLNKTGEGGNRFRA